MTRKEILEDSRRCVCGDREQDYGSPENNFGTIAAYWGRHLWARHPELQTVIAPNALVDAVDVAVMLALLKIARIGSGHAKMDNWIDLAGYAACGGEIESQHANTKQPEPEPEPEPKAEPVMYNAEAETQTYSPCAIVVYEDDSWTWGKNNSVTCNPELGVKYHYLNCVVQRVRLPNGDWSYGWWHIEHPPISLCDTEEFWNGD